MMIIEGSALYRWLTVTSLSIGKAIEKNVLKCSEAR